MNILYLAHRIPFPPDKGDKLRAHRQIEHLARRHRIWCACFVDTPSDRRFIKPLSSYCRNLAAIPLGRAAATVRGLAGLLAGGTVTESFYHCAAMERVLRRWASTVRFDAVVAFSSCMARYALAVPARRRVLDLCDLDSEKWLDYAAASSGPLRWLYRAEGTRLARRERDWLGAFDAGILITEAEARPVRDVAPPGRLHVVGNGVTLPTLSGHPRVSGFAESGRAKGLSQNARGTGVEAGPSNRRSVLGIGSKARAPLGTTCQESTVAQDAAGSRPTIGFVGTMNYRPNVDAVCWFVANCWPAIRATRPKACFRIVGRGPTRRVHRLARVAGVRVVGEVDDVWGEMQRWDVSVAPMRIARGLQNKVLEAMAAAKPVVLSSRAAEGIAGHPGEDYLVADTAEEVVAGVLRLVSDPKERARLGANARRFVAAHHCWEAELQKFELIVAGIIGRTARMDSVSARTPAKQREDRVLVDAV